jgi:protein TonB
MDAFLADAPLNRSGSEVLMFEDSLVVSRIVPASAARRWTIAGSTALQAAVAAVLIVVPLLHPELLSFHVSTPLVFTPPPPKPPLPQAQPERVAQGSTSVTLPIAAQHPTLTPTSDARPAAEEPPLMGRITGMGSIEIPDVLANGDGHGARVSVAPTQAPVTPRHVSQGVLAGMLLSPIRPVYPAIAKAAGVSGTVVVEAVISKSGMIESLHVVSGPGMLREAALDAIRSARYQPFRLNGEPTEVQTTITVNFRLG